MNHKVDLGTLSIDMSTGKSCTAFSVILNDKILHAQEINTSKVEQVAAVMTLLAAGLIIQDTAEIFLTRINSK
jgi:hypothetical protein